MIVYHGSSETVRKPDILHSYRALDFGRGFYVTTVREQAERWARRKAALSGRKALVNRYLMGDDMTGLRVRQFPDDLSEWIEFVCACRDEKPVYQAFDLIIGKVANDKVFRVVDMYHSGIWDKVRALMEIRAYPNYDQLAFITQRAIDKLLRFDGVSEVCAVDDRILEQVYQENLEERLIDYIAVQHDLTLEEAMDIYYSSRLAERIHRGEEGIQYLDYKVLAQILHETEPERFLAAPLP